jgi:hypothetical protein
MLCVAQSLDAPPLGVTHRVSQRRAAPVQERSLPSLNPCSVAETSGIEKGTLFSFDLRSHFLFVNATLTVETRLDNSTEESAHNSA